MVQTETHWQGPLPSPQTLEEFRQLVPDAPERIFRQWEEETAHRRSYERAALDAAIAKDRFGLRSAIVFSMSALGVGVFALWMEEPWVAGIVVGGTITGVVASFLAGHKK